MLPDKLIWERDMTENKRSDWLTLQKRPFVLSNDRWFLSFNPSSTPCHRYRVLLQSVKALQLFIFWGKVNKEEIISPCGKHSLSHLIMDRKSVLLILAALVGYCTPFTGKTQIIWQIMHIFSLFHWIIFIHDP